MNANHILLQHVTDYHQRHFNVRVNKENLSTVIMHWPELFNVGNNTLNRHDLNAVKTFIRQSDKHQRLEYQLAYQQLTDFLVKHSLLSLPESELKHLKSQDEQWVERVYQQIARSNQVLNWYQMEKSRFVHERGQPSLTFAAIALAIEVAPLSLYHLAKILSQPQHIDHSNLNVKVIHNRKMKEEQKAIYHTTYRLTPFLYRLLLEPSLNTTNITTDKLHNAINQTFTVLDGMAFSSPLDFKATMECIWLHSHTLPRNLLNDLATPERHVAPRPIQPLKIEVNKKPHTKVRRSEHAHSYWPHRTALMPLIRSANNLNALRKATVDIAQPELNSDNVLPKLLFDYTIHRIQKGGTIKPNLALGSIALYCGIEKQFQAHPLTYDCAMEEESINDWALALYKTLSSGNQTLVRYFFGFLAHHPLTEYLDLSLFTPPYEPPSVSAFRISPNELDTLVRSLLILPNESLLTRLYGAIAAILGFHGMLRRGEVCRLRIKDVRALPYLNDLSFHLTITSTDEGNPKGHKHRYATICLPPEQAELLTQLLKLKKNEPETSPLLSLRGQTLSQRTEQFIQPVSQLMKQLFGEQAHFHHLRHSGAHVLNEQLLRLAYDRLYTRQYYYIDDNHFVFESTTVKARLHYWLQGREFLTVNAAILFDELCRPLGHAHYATTRWSYLHGIEWLPELLESDKIAYTHAELRYIFNLSPTSNDISRRIKAMSPDVYALSITERKQDPVFINQQTLIQTLTQNSPKRTHTAHEFTLYETWIEEYVPSGFYSLCEHQFLLHTDKCLSFNTLSQLAEYSRRSTWKKGTFTSLKKIFHSINTKGLQSDLPYFSVFTSPSKAVGETLTTLMKTEMKWLPMRYVHHLNKDAKASLPRRKQNTAKHFPRPQKGEAIQRHREGESTLEIQFYHPEPNAMSTKQELAVIADMISTMK
ncbi:hypothetical protein [Vibrio metschnikovii]|uniref:hypothetical protein n=1 Tax=Vibrio metschnikovii TaxID=28172 RepID=UPI002FC6F105